MNQAKLNLLIMQHILILKITHYAAYSDTKDLAKRTMSNKSLKGIDYEIARNCKYDEYQRALVFYKNRGSGVSLNE